MRQTALETSFPTSRTDFEQLKKNLSDPKVLLLSTETDFKLNSTHQSNCLVGCRFRSWFSWTMCSPSLLTPCTLQSCRLPQNLGGHFPPFPFTVFKCFLMFDHVGPHSTVFVSGIVSVVAGSRVRPQACTLHSSSDARTLCLLHGGFPWGCSFPFLSSDLDIGCHSPSCLCLPLPPPLCLCFRGMTSAKGQAKCMGCAWRGSGAGAGEQACGVLQPIAGNVGLVTR